MVNVIIDPANRLFRTTMLFNSPIENVWEAWANPERIAKWWGPEGFTSDILKMDVVKNGEWLLTMHGPDGKRYPNKSVYQEIEPHKKIIFQHFNPHYLAIVDFEPRGSQTQMEWSMQFETAELFEVVVKTFKADEGFKQSVEKLENYLKG